MFQNSSMRSDVEQVIACPEFAPALYKLQRPQPAEGIVKTAAIGFVAGFDRDFIFGQRIRIGLGECLQNQPLCFS